MGSFCRDGFLGLCDSFGIYCLKKCLLLIIDLSEHFAVILMPSISVISNCLNRNSRFVLCCKPKTKSSMFKMSSFGTSFHDTILFVFSSLFFPLLDFCSYRSLSTLVKNYLVFHRLQNRSVISNGKYHHVFTFFDS